jgi:hypothetical protein
MEKARFWIEEKPKWKNPNVYSVVEIDTPAMCDARRRHNRATEQAAAARLARLKAAPARKQTRKQARKQAASVASAARKQAAAAVAAAAAAYRADEAAGMRMREQAAAATGRDITAVVGRQVQGRFGLALHYMVKIDDVTVPLLDGESVAEFERNGELVIDVIHRIWVGKKYAERTDNV